MLAKMYTFTYDPVPWPTWLIPLAAVVAAGVVVAVVAAILFVILRDPPTSD